MCWDCETLAKQFSRKIRLSRQTPGYVLIREFLLSGWCLVPGGVYEIQMLFITPHALNCLVSVRTSDERSS